MIRNIVVVSDTHAGCRLGLCPPEVALDDGGYYRHSDLQSKVYHMWTQFWDSWVPKVTKGEPYVVVFNGDAIDGVHHGSVTQVSHNLIDQGNIAKKLLCDVAALPNCERWYHIRGTEAHVGKSGQSEEGLAAAIGAVPDENGNCARWEMWLRLGEELIHFSHHVGTTSSSSYESTAVYKEMVEAFNESGRWGDQPPTVIVRSHRHRQFETRIATKSGYGIALVTPGWQLKTPFVHRLASGRASTPQIGGYLIRLGDEDGVYTRFKVWKVERSREEVL